jgi:hypothetical protein
MMIAVDFERGDGEHEQDADIDVCNHPAGIDRDHRPGGQRQRHRHQRREQEHGLVGARWNHRLLEDELQKVGKRLEQTPRADHVRTAAQLHGSPDLAVGVEDVGDEHQQSHQQQQRLRQNDGPGPDISCDETVHGVSRPYSAATALAVFAKAEHSAITADARAIGLVK